MNHLSIVAMTLAFVLSTHNAMAVSQAAIETSIQQSNVDSKIKAEGGALTDEMRNALMKLEKAGIKVTAEHVDALKAVMKERAEGRAGFYQPPLELSVLDVINFPAACTNQTKVNTLRPFPGWLKIQNSKLVFRAFEHAYLAGGGNPAHGVDTKDGLRNFPITNIDSGAKEFTGQIGSSATDPVFSSTPDAKYVMGHIDAKGALMCISKEIKF